jgi:flavin-dependent dehydrogenase
VEGVDVIEATVVIVGGGPGGSACAWRLGQRGIDSVVLEAEPFPRTKLCAGWITPAVVRALEMDVERYPRGLLRLDNLHMEYFGRRRPWRTDMRSDQYSIRRYEFDDWLLRRSGAPVVTHAARAVERVADGFVVDGQFRGRFLVGAGGTHCPVFRALFKGVNPRSREYQVAALEEEFEYEGADQRCHLWFGENGLVGYAWYVPKQRGWVNVGLGGFSRYLAESRVGLHEHWQALVDKLAGLGLVVGHRFRPKGHTYYLREREEVCQVGNAYLVGDAAGLATLDLAEGIGPAIQSGLNAAESIATGCAYSLDGVPRYSLIGDGWLESRLARWIDRRGLVFRDWIYARHWKAKEADFLATHARESAAAS